MILAWVTFNMWYKSAITSSSLKSVLSQSSSLSLQQAWQGQSLELPGCQVLPALLVPKARLEWTASQDTLEPEGCQVLKDLLALLD